MVENAEVKPVPKNVSSLNIVFFDGVCNLCNSAVQTLIKMDKRNNLKFSALQGQLARELILPFLPAENEAFTTMIFFKAGEVYTKSTAAIEIARTAGGFWKIAVLGYILPRLLRDWAYNLVSRNRYQWFGKQETCWLPTPELKSKFL